MALDPRIADRFALGGETQPPAAVPPEAGSAPLDADRAPSPSAPTASTTRPATFDANYLTGLVQKLREGAAQPDIAGLAKAQASDADREREMALGRSGALALGLMTHRAPDYTGLTPDQMNVRNWVAQQQELDKSRHLANEELRGASYLAHWLGRGQAKPGADDPNHPVSVAARAAYRGTAAGADLAQRLGAQFDNLTATDIAQVDKIRADRAVKPADAPADDVDQSELKKRGIEPGLAKTHGDAMTLIQHYEQNRAMKERSGIGGASGDMVSTLADGIEKGISPPDMKGLYKYGGPVRAELAKRGYDLTSASRDWQGAQRYMSSLNGPQQLRLRQAVDAANGQLDVVSQLYDEWKQKGVSTGVKLFNRGALAAAKNMGGDAGAAAQALESQIALLTGELGNTLMGGNSPTDHALTLARNMLQGDWNEEQFKKGITQLRRDLQIRQNSLSSIGPAGVAPESPYAPKVQ